jgi:hypothetical protein
MVIHLVSFADFIQVSIASQPTAITISIVIQVKRLM